MPFLNMLDVVGVHMLADNVCMDDQLFRCGTYP